MTSETNASERSIETARLAGYCAALAGASLATSAEASVVELSFDPGSVPYVVSFTPTYGDTVSYGRNVGVLNGASFVGSFYQFNDPIGQSFNANTGIAGFRTAVQSETITAGQAFTFGGNASTNTLFGFLTDGGDVGWIRFTIGQNGAISYTGGLNPDGGPILAGSLEHGPPSDVPLPASLPLAALGTLALGAVGLRRKRAKAKADA